jgi:hypothetical protein
MISEEREIYTDYDGCHRHHVKHGSYAQDDTATGRRQTISRRLWLGSRKNAA